MTPALTPETCRARRIALGLPVGQFAIRAELSPSTVKKFEAGRWDAGPSWRAIFERGLTKLESERRS